MGKDEVNENGPKLVTVTNDISGFRKLWTEAKEWAEAMLARGEEMTLDEMGEASGKRKEWAERMDKEEEQAAFAYMATLLKGLAKKKKR